MTYINIDPATRKKLRKSAGWGIALGILLAILGAIAIIVPLVATVAMSLLLGWLFIIGGIAEIIYAFKSRQAGYVIWKVLLGLFYILAGIFVLSSPIVTALTLTWIVALGILITSVIQVFFAFRMRSERGWGWILVSGIAGIILSILIWSRWPSSAAWFLGSSMFRSALSDSGNQWQS
jgi:uncharacterized membrane protein HdeD (DUF308 family)